MSEIAHVNTAKPVCPYCGIVMLENEDIDAFDSGEVECESCNMTFNFEKQVETTYTTNKISN